jgi:hypothetical protein
MQDYGRSTAAAGALNLNEFGFPARSSPEIENERRI